MYTELDLLESVKSAFGVPNNLIELDDERILNFLIKEVRRDFSKYHPYERTFTLTESDLINVNSNIFTIPEEKCSEIINVKSVLDDATSVLSGFSASNNRVDFDLLDSIDRTMSTQGSSRSGELTFKFQHPNELTVFERSSNTLVVKVNRLHLADFSTVSYNEQDILERYAKINIAEKLIAIRRKYGSFNTPFGEIQLDLETITEILASKQEFMESERKAGNLTKRIPFIIA